MKTIILLSFAIFCAFAIAVDEVSSEFDQLSYIYINLDRRLDRRSHMERLFKSKGIVAERLPAIDGMALKAYYETGKPYDFHPEPQTQFHPDNLKPFLKYLPGHYGRIGCWQSHVQVYLKIINRVERGEPDVPTLIMEDDLKWSPSFSIADLKKHMQMLPNDWGIIVYGGHYIHAKRGSRRYGDFVEAIYSYGSGSYVVRNAEVAKKLAKHLNTAKPQIMDLAWSKVFIHECRTFITSEFIPQDLQGFTSDIASQSRPGYLKEPLWHEDQTYLLRKSC